MRGSWWAWVFACALAAPAAAAASGSVGTVLFVVVNSSSLDSQESTRKSMMEDWGYTVTPISDTASQATYDAGVRASSVAYICETALSGNVSTKLTSAPIGVVTEESALSDELGFAGSMTTMTEYRVNIVNNTHFITNGMSTGNTALFTGSQPLRYLSGAQGGYTALGQSPRSTSVTFAVMDFGATLTPSGTAVGRRVYLPWGNKGVDINSLTADGRSIMHRALVWCSQPVAHWKLDDASGGTAADEMGSFHGTVIGATWDQGRIGGALQFDGTGHYVSVASATRLQLTRALSVAAWMRCDADSSWPTGSITAPIVRKGTSEPSNYAVQVADGKLAMFLDAADTAGVRGNTVLQTGQWYHLAATWDGTSVRLYVNGVLDNAPTSKAAPIGSDTRAVHLGGRAGGERFDGELDDVRLYPRCLTAAEVTGMMAEHPLRVKRWREVAVTE